jgi:hemoglobin-like flavoprotein
MDIGESVSLVLASRDSFGNAFYAEFFRRSPEAKAYFARLDMERQAFSLTMALPLIEQLHRHGYPAIQNYLRILGHRHGHRGIPPELYPAWSEAMVASLARFHGEAWDAGLAEQWREALAEASRVMLDGYGGSAGM